MKTFTARRWAFCTLFALLLIPATSILQAESSGKEEHETLALKASLAWLEVVDAGSYDTSWNSTATYFRQAVAQDAWQRTLQAFRTPLGKVISRKVKSLKHTTSLPGAPDGHYVVIDYNTSFENKKATIERVTPMREADGSWKVSGYFFQ